MKQISKNEKIVVLVTFIPRYTGQVPSYMDYKAENLNGVRPCIQVADGSLRDLRTSEPVATSEKNFVPSPLLRFSGFKNRSSRCTPAFAANEANTG